MDLAVWKVTVPASRTIGVEHEAHTLLVEYDAGGFVSVRCSEDDTVFVRRAFP